jgi:hypothetical protein
MDSQHNIEGSKEEGNPSKPMVVPFPALADLGISLWPLKESQYLNSSLEHSSECI